MIEFCSISLMWVRRKLSKILMLRTSKAFRTFASNIQVAFKFSIALKFLTLVLLDLFFIEVFETFLRHPHEPMLS